MSVAAPQMDEKNQKKMRSSKSESDEANIEQRQH